MPDKQDHRCDFAATGVPRLSKCSVDGCETVRIEPPPVTASGVDDARKCAAAGCEMYMCDAPAGWRCATHRSSDPIQERIDYYRGKYLGRDPHEVMVLIAIEEANRILAEGAGQRAEEIVAGYEAMLGQGGRPRLDERVTALEARAENGAVGKPIVRHGDVAAQLTNELTSLFRHYAALLAFEQKVAEAAQSPAAWLALRDEVRK